MSIPAKKETLRDYLGRWEYSYGTSDKYYIVVPDAFGTYSISWGRIGFPPHGQADLVDNIETFRRIRTKQQGGYTLKTPYSVMRGKDPKLPNPVKADITVKDIQGVPAKTIANKSKRNKEPKTPVMTPNKRRGFSFLEWAAGTDGK